MAEQRFRILSPEQADARYLRELPEYLNEPELGAHILDTIDNRLNVSTAFKGRVLQTRGNSWVEGGGDYAAPYPELLPEALGFTSILNRGRAGRKVQDNAQVMVNSANPYAFDTAFQGPLLINDLGNNLSDPDNAANRTTALQALRAMVALASASSRVEQTSWTFKNNGSNEAWNAESAQPYASGGSVRVGVFGGLQIDIPVTAGTSYLLCHGTDASVARGMTIRVSQNGTQIASQTLDGQTLITTNEANNGVSPVVIQLPNLSTGTVTVTTDQAGITGSLAIVDALLPQSAEPRLIMVAKPVQVTATTHNKPALLTYLRTLPDLIAEEFGDNILVIDPAEGWDPETMLGADKLHMTPAGTAHLRNAVVSAVKDRVWERIVQASL